jgi:hypothetical protein
MYTITADANQWVTHLIARINVCAAIEQVLHPLEIVISSSLM